ncbi:MAG: thiamine-phosphate kinase [Thermoplasmata archaeon]|nr:thiamine-phosphate kinase [Thermoplasmata archaeon]
MRTPKRARAHSGPKARRFREESFHGWLERALRRGGSGLLPMGDDVAALQLGGRNVLLTTDALSEGTHFQDRSPPEWIGDAAVAASFSDLASKGGRPVAVLLDLLIPPATPARWVKRVVSGAERRAAREGCHVVGGDTKAAKGRSVVGTAVGTSRIARLPRRDSARPGDLLLVTGTVGRGGARARAFLEGHRAGRRELVDLLRIEPRLREGEALAPLAHAMIDSSDGLADAARRLAHASEVRVVVDEKRIPWDPGVRSLRPASRRVHWGLYGGDYELVAVLPPSRLRRAIRAVSRTGTKATVIGAVSRGRGAFLSTQGRLGPMPRPGWDPFAPVPTVRRYRPLLVTLK